MPSAPQIIAPSRAEQARRGSACRSCREEIGIQCSSSDAHHLFQLCPDSSGFENGFDLDRFLPEREAALSPGASVPFGGCARMCVGSRLGEYELRALATVLFTPWRFDSYSTDLPRLDDARSGRGVSCAW